MSYNSTEGNKLSQRDMLVIAGAIVAVVIAAVVIVRIVLADRPYAVNKPPAAKGFSEKLQGLKADEQARQAKEKVAGDDFQP
ncbi:MAG: hypothetical protein SFU56_06405 [Capsulimonadales bacterium]|nr:hypothetical protein [Capsulimonadales bacterium]